MKNNRHIEKALNSLKNSPLKITKQRVDIIKILFKDGNDHFTAEDVHRKIEKLGLNRISAGQCINLNKWQNIMELTGYKIEGVHKDKFVKGMIISDVMKISCSKNDYLYLKKKRGKLWDNKNNMLKRIKKLPKVTALKKIKDQLKFLDNQYYKKIFNL